MTWQHGLGRAWKARLQSNLWPHNTCKVGKIHRLQYFQIMPYPRRFLFYAYLCWGKVWTSLFEVNLKATFRLHTDIAKPYLLGRKCRSVLSNGLCIMHRQGCLERVNLILCYHFFHQLPRRHIDEFADHFQQRAVAERKLWSTSTDVISRRRQCHGA